MINLAQMTWMEVRFYAQSRPRNQFNTALGPVDENMFGPENEEEGLSSVEQISPT